MAIVWILAMDAFLVMYMRDSVLLFFNVFLKIKVIIDWQAQGVVIGKARAEKNMSLLCPLSAFLSSDNEETKPTDEEAAPLNGN